MSFERLRLKDSTSCATARRKPGTFTNTMRLSIPETDDLVLSTIEGEVLGRPVIDALLAYVETTPDVTAQLGADRERLQTEMTRLVESIAAGVPASAVAPQIRARDFGRTREKRGCWSGDWSDR